MSNGEPNLFVTLTDCFVKLDSLRRFSQRRSPTQVLCTRCVRCDVSSDRIALFTFCVMCHDSAKRYILGAAHPGGRMTSKFALGRDFCAMHVLQVSSSYYVYSFGCYRVDTQTHKHTDRPTNRLRRKHPTFFATLRRWVIRPCLR